jgi:twitching motility protein PilT
VLRRVESVILSPEELGLPPVVRRLAENPRGLVLVTGPTGSGKSTTLAAMMDYANLQRQDHIITVEDPIEFVHRSQNCLVQHREVGIHTRSFAAALRGSLREDPDIILVGELRDLETIELALTAAATGHLVFGTLHTSSASKAVDRIIDVFPTNQQNQIRATLAESLKGVIAQNLFKRIDKPGRVAALEILVVDMAISNLVREGKTHQIPGMIQVGKKKGNQPLDDAIMDHLRNMRISPEEAYDKCIDKKKFRQFLKEPPADASDE